MSDLRATIFRGRTSGSVPDFPDGVTVVSGISTLDSQGVRVAGIVTATSFSGDGSSLTSIASIVTGNTSVQTVDTGSDGHVKVNTEGSERLRITSGGQTLINTTNNGSDAEPPLIVSGRANDATDSGMIRIKRGTVAASMSAGDSIGDITFTALDGGNAAQIGVKAGTGWGGTSDSPGELLFQTTPDGSGTLAERMRITANGGLLLSNGILVERCKIVTTEWNTTNDISLDDGNVFLNTSNLGGTGTTIDITSSNGLDTDLAVGDMTSVTLITAVNAATAYINAITIGAAGVTESWVGGSAPTDGGSSGYDVYTFNIIKKDATPTWVVIANQVKGS